MTGGKFVISVHAAGELMPAFGVVDGVQQGSIECAHTAPYYFFGKDETFALDCAIPFGMNSRQMTAWMFEGNGMKLMREFYNEFNIVNFPMGNTGAQMGGWYRKEINTLEDLKGLKFRTGGFPGRVMERMGVVPQNIPGGEIYQALEKGTIDAAEWIGPYDDLKLGFNKVAKNYYYPGWWEGGPQLSLLVNSKAYAASAQGIPGGPGCRVGLRPCGHAGQVRRPQPQRAQAARGFAGVKVLPFSKVIWTKPSSRPWPLYDELSAKNPKWKKVYADYSAFRKDQNLWFRFTEATFDRYMQSAKL